MLTIDGEHIRECGRATCFLRQTERFKEREYTEGSRDIRLGNVSATAKRLVKTAAARVLSPAEDMNGMTLFGTSEAVMRRSWEMVLRRAARRGHTEANGGVYVHRDTAAMDTYTETQLNALRTYGFEQEAFAVGAKAADSLWGCGGG